MIQNYGEFKFIKHNRTQKEIDEDIVSFSDEVERYNNQVDQMIQDRLK
jgi:hypothetical protein